MIDSDWKIKTPVAFFIEKKKETSKDETRND